MDNPISNALPELVKDGGCGGRIALDAVPSADSSLSPLELWCNEAQERYVLAIAAEDLPRFELHAFFEDWRSDHLRLAGDPQAFLQRLAQKTAIQHFEITKPALHDIFVRIAQPTAEDMKRPVAGAD